MEKSKINVMFPINFLGIGGAEQQLLELVKGIDKSHFNPIVVPLYPGGQLFEEIKQVPDVELISLNRKGKLDFLTLKKIYSLINEKKVDIIQPFSTPAAFFSLIPAILGRVPVKIRTERGGLRAGTRIGFALYQKIEDYITRYVDLVVANSEAGKNYLIKRGIKPDYIKVIYNGINFNRLKPDNDKVLALKKTMNIPEDGTVIGMTANIAADKDYNTFIRGAKIIHDIFPQTRFTILGDGPLKMEIEKLVKELNLVQAVFFLGHQRDVATYMSFFDIACLCADDSEGCSNVILESMALEKPIVATDGGGNREVVENGVTGFLVPMKSPQAFADAVISCIRKPDLTKEMGKRGKEKVFKQFSLTRMVRDYEILFEQTLYSKQKV